LTHLLILSSRTGGGHRACAEALKATFDARYPSKIRVSIIDLWSDHAPAPLQLLPAAYPHLVQHAPSVWKLLWHATKSSYLSNILFAIVAKWSGPHIVSTIAQLEPDLIICVHPIVQRAVLATLHSAPHNANSQIYSHLCTCPWFTVVTDLCASHPYWFDRHATRCFVDGPTTAHHAQKFGVNDTQLRAYGLPIHPAFRQLSDKFGQSGRCISARADLRRKLGMDSTLPAVLVMGGGDGVGQVARVADQIAKRLSVGSTSCGQLVVLCGHNESLRHTLQRKTWLVPTRICGFVENVPEWMAVSDCVVTKAGPSTIAESLSMGKPLLLMNFIPGQESKNIEWVVKGGAGIYCAEPDKLANNVHRLLLGKPESKFAFAAAAKKLSTPVASERIVDEIMTFVR